MSTANPAPHLKHRPPSIDWANWASWPLFSDIIQCFQSIPFAVTLFCLLAVATLIGVFAPQEGIVEQVEIEAQYGQLYTAVEFIGLTHVFSSVWYLTLEGLFFFSILIGSFKWLKAATAAATQVTFFSEPMLAIKPEAVSFPFRLTMTPDKAHEQLAASLRKAGYKIHMKRAEHSETLLYACKGNLTRFGPHLAHIGILMCLIASLWGTFTGFKAQKLVVPDAPPFNLAAKEVDMFQANMKPLSWWQGHVPDWFVGAVNFKIDKYPNGSPKQYYSDVTIYDAAGDALAQKTISVNDPLVYQNLTIYQASFSPSGRFFLNINGETRRVEINNQFNERPVSMFSIDDKRSLVMLPFFSGQDPGVDKNYAVFVLRNHDGKSTRGKMPPNIQLFEGQSGRLGDLNITYEGAEMATGLQIKSAPEVGLMYTAFIIICIGAVLSYFSQRQIWLAIKPLDSKHVTVTLCPKTNKGRFSFYKELASLRRTWLHQFSPSDQEAPVV